MKRAPNGRIQAKNAPLGLMIVGFSSAGGMLTVCDTLDGAIQLYAKGKIRMEYWCVSSERSLETYMRYYTPSASRVGASRHLRRVERGKRRLWEDGKPSRKKKKVLLDRYVKFLAFWISRRHVEPDTAHALFQHYERIAQDAMVLADHYRKMQPSSTGGQS